MGKLTSMEIGPKASVPRGSCGSRVFRRTMRSIRLVDMRRGEAVIAVVCLALAVTSTTGCSSDPPSTITRVKPIPVEVAKSGRLKRKPSPLTLADVARQAPDSPQRQVLLAWFLGQWGGGTSTAQVVYSRALHGAWSDIAKAYSIRQASMIELRPVIAKVGIARGIARVRLSLLSADAQPKQVGYELVRERQAWRIVQDEFLDVGVR